MNHLVTAPQYLTPSDREHLKILSICGYIYAGLQCIGALFVLIYAGIGFTMVSQGEEFGWFFVGFAALAGVIILTFILLTFFATKWMGEGKNWLFCMIIAALHCASFPFGTALGVFVIIVINRPQVKAWFLANRAE